MTPRGEEGLGDDELGGQSPTEAAGNHSLPLASILLVLTATISLLWSHHKLLDQDELFVLQTDSVSSLRELVHIQHTYPISLDPLVYHILAHASAQVFGTNAFALRLPSLLGFLLMQACLFLFVRRLAGERAALIALTFPAVTATLFYSAEARPYGLLLGFYALTLLSWHLATHGVVTAAIKARSPKPEARSPKLEARSPKLEADIPPFATDMSSRPEQSAVEKPAAPTSEASRLAPLLTLAAAIALTLNSHYFGILLLMPLCAAELFRTLQRRRLDLPVIAAIAAGIASIVFTLPFQKAAGEFRKHYYTGGRVGLHAITQAYRSLFVDYTRSSESTQRLAAALFVVLALALIAAAIYRVRTRTLALPAPETIFILTLAALPFFGFLLARFVTHSIEVRYVLGAIIGIAVLVALVAAPLLRSDAVWRPILVLLFLAVAGSGALRIHGEARATDTALNRLLPTPQLRAALLASPDKRLYIQEMGHFEFARYYEPDPALRDRITLVYSAANELRWNHHDTEALTAEHMQHFTALPPFSYEIVRYEDLRQQRGDHVFILYYGGWNWTRPALPADGATVTLLGPDMEGDAALVHFR